MSIPSEEDFARARRAREERDRNWSEISAGAERRIREVMTLHEFVLFPRQLCSFHAIVFFRSDEDLRQAKADRLDELVCKLVTDAVRDYRSGECMECQISVELDSDENVRRNYGSYFNRLR